MTYSLYQLLWFFLLYSFIGWCAGVIVSALRKKAFVNTGFLNAPLCPVYGFGAVFCTIFLTELNHRLFFLFVGGAIIAAFITFLTGFILEKIFHRRWWDFSGSRLQFEGYINLPYVAACGLAAVICVRFTNPLLADLLGFIPLFIGKIILLVVLVLFTIDFAETLAAILQIRFRVRRISEVTEDVTEDLQEMSDKLGNAITKRIHRRMMKAYPNLEAKKLLEAEKIKEAEAIGKSKVFAEGCCFYKLFVLFMIGAFLGDIVETIFCYMTAGVWMSRSSVVYGPFSIVWGLGCALLTALLYKYKDKNDRYLFISGTVLGGAYEYLCSVFTELVFGTVFWDYSGIPFNLGGRINLLYCFFWGVAAVVWLKGIYPILSARIEKIPKRTGVIGSNLLIIFMVVNIIVSGLAMARYSERQISAAPAQTAVGTFFDERFPDSRMNRIYPNAIVVDDTVKEDAAEEGK